MIPKQLGHIWIGPYSAPSEWMQTWIERHPDWKYRLFDNDFLTSRTFICQKQIIEYYQRAQFAGVSDLMRYEILYEQGGFLPEADSVCLSPVDELFQDQKCYSVYELPDDEGGMISPWLASNSGNRLLLAILKHLRKAEPNTLGMPWKAVGNDFLRRFLKKYPHQEHYHIYPCHYFIPNHLPRGIHYSGSDKIYADQKWGTTKKNYPHSNRRSGMTQEEIREKIDDVVRKLVWNLENLEPAIDVDL